MSKLDFNLPHIQHLIIQSEIEPINLLNTYIPHDTQSKHHTINTLTAITCPSNLHFVVGGDLNAYQCRKLDYYTNIQNKTKNNTKEKQFQSISNNKLIDSFRVLNPFTKKFTKWTVNSNTSPIKITASRLDHFLISKSLRKKLTQSEIIENDLTNTDHYPIIINLNLLTPKKPPKIIKIHPPDYINWPDSLAKEIEKHIIILKDKPINSPRDIENFTTILSEAILQNWNNYINSITPTSKKIQHKEPHLSHLDNISKLRKTLLTFKHNLLKSSSMMINLFIPHINKINQTIELLFPNKCELLIPTNNLTNIISTTTKVIHKTTNKLHNLSKRIKQEKIKKKINSILENNDLSSKTIYKIIKNNREFNQINYVTTNDDPYPIIINLNLLTPKKPPKIIKIHKLRRCQ